MLADLGMGKGKAEGIWGSFSPASAATGGGAFSKRAQPVLWFLELRSSRNRKGRGPASGTRWRFRVFPGGCEGESGTKPRQFSDLGLDTLPAAGRGAGRPGEKGDLDVHETLQRGLDHAIAPDRGQNQAAESLCRRNLDPPELYHV